MGILKDYDDWECDFKIYIESVGIEDVAETLRRLKEHVTWDAKDLIEGGGVMQNPRVTATGMHMRISRLAMETSFVQYATKLWISPKLVCGITSLEVRCVGFPMTHWKTAMSLKNS